jgi:hypothetical protein
MCAPAADVLVTRKKTLVNAKSVKNKLILCNILQDYDISRYTSEISTLKEEETEVDHSRDGWTNSPNREIGTGQKA